jgi:hypothetical protein
MKSLLTFIPLFLTATTVAHAQVGKLPTGKFGKGGFPKMGGGGKGLTQPGGQINSPEALASPGTGRHGAVWFFHLRQYH